MFEFEVVAEVEFDTFDDLMRHLSRISMKIQTKCPKFSREESGQIVPSILLCQYHTMYQAKFYYGWDYNSILDLGQTTTD